MSRFGLALLALAVLLMDVLGGATTARAQGSPEEPVLALETTVGEPSPDGARPILVTASGYAPAPALRLHVGWDRRRASCPDTPDLLPAEGGWVFDTQMADDPYRIVGPGSFSESSTLDLQPGFVRLCGYLTDEFDDPWTVVTRGVRINGESTTGPRRVIRVLRGWRVIAGGFDTQRGIASAERSLGPAEIRPYPDGFGCDVRWPALGARFFFYDLGGQGHCHPTGASVGTAQLTGATWATWRGLRIGDPEGLVRRRHREAILCDRRFMSPPAGRRYSLRLKPRELKNLKRRCARVSSAGGANRYWLAPVFSPIGSGGFYPRVSVVARGGRVTAFELSIGAGGD